MFPPLWIVVSDMLTSFLNDMIILTTEYVCKIYNAKNSEKWNKWKQNSLMKAFSFLYLYATFAQISVFMWL